MQGSKWRLLDQRLYREAYGRVSVSSIYSLLVRTRFQGSGPEFWRVLTDAIDTGFCSMTRADRSAHT